MKWFKERATRWHRFLTVATIGGNITISALWYRRARNLLLASLVANLLLFWGLARALDHERADQALLNNINYLANKAEQLTVLYAAQLEDLNTALLSYGRSFTDSDRAETHLHQYNLAIDLFENRGKSIRELGLQVREHAKAIQETGGE